MNLAKTLGRRWRVDSCPGVAQFIGEQTLLVSAKPAQEIVVGLEQAGEVAQARAVFGEQDHTAILV